jgi:C-terminal processing protease CtpA/Prc
MSRASYAFFREKRGEVEGLTLRIDPDPLAPRYTGRVFVLTSGKTASAAEPVVYGIQHYKLGQVVGATTAGMVLSMEELPLDRYTFQLPMMDYYTPDGRRLDQVGVRPDHAVEPGQALEYVLTKLLP